VLTGLSVLLLLPESRGLPRSSLFFKLRSGAGGTPVLFVLLYHTIRYQLALVSSYHTDGFASTVGSSCCSSCSRGGYIITSTPVIHIANANGHDDSIGSFFYSMSRPSAVDRIAAELFSQSINRIVAPVSTGLLSLLALFVVEAKHCLSLNCR
jgi:hypothetical protein